MRLLLRRVYEREGAMDGGRKLGLGMTRGTSGAFFIRGGLASEITGFG
jgi:hypothetical protein